MTPAQLKALQSYVASVVRVMTRHMDAHAQNVALLLESKRVLEREFGMLMPVEHDFPDLFNVDTPKPPALPDLL